MKLEEVESDERKSRAREHCLKLRLKGGKSESNPVSDSISRSRRLEEVLAVNLE